MMRSRTIPSKDDMDRAHDGVMAEAERIRSEPVPLTPLDAKYRVGKTIVFAMVEHRKNDSGTALLLSLDGYWDHAKWFPIHRLRIHRSTVEPRFLVVQVPGSLANDKELPTQATRPRLTPLIAWSEEAQAEWRRVTTKRIEINDALKLKGRNYRKKYERLRFAETA
jgi:hypothetical protein